MCAEAPGSLGPGADPAKGDVALRSKSAGGAVAEKILADLPHLIDLATLSKMELRQKYAVEASTHRNMLSRGQKRGNIIHPEFRDFASFLRHVGPVPAHGATLDRIDNADPEYGPRKVRWADKRTQNGNKGDTLVFFYSRTWETYTSSLLAALRNVSPSTIRKRRERGWTDDEIIEGVRAMPEFAPQAMRIPEPIRPPQQRAAPPARQMTARDVLHQRLVQEHEHTRREYGQDVLPMTYEEAQADHPEMAFIPRARMMEHLKEWWALHKPYVQFKTLSEHHQEIIEELDPQYVASLRQTERLSQLL